MTSEAICDVRASLVRHLRVALQGYLEGAQLLELAQGDELNHAHQTAESAMLKVTTAHEELIEHVAMHRCQDAQSTSLRAIQLLDRDA